MKKKKGRKEEEEEKPQNTSIFARLKDQELVLHTSRSEGSFLLGYFLVWGHGNGIWLS